MYRLRVSTYSSVFVKPESRTLPTTATLKHTGTFNQVLEHSAFITSCCEISTDLVLNFVVSSQFFFFLIYWYRNIALITFCACRPHRSKPNFVISRSTLFREWYVHFVHVPTEYWLTCHYDHGCDQESRDFSRPGFGKNPDPHFNM